MPWCLNDECKGCYDKYLGFDFENFVFTGGLNQDKDADDSALSPQWLRLVETEYKQILLRS